MCKRMWNLTYWTEKLFLYKKKEESLSKFFDFRKICKKWIHLECRNIIIVTHHRDRFHALPSLYKHYMSRVPAAEPLHLFIYIYISTFKNVRTLVIESSLLLLILGKLVAIVYFVFCFILLYFWILNPCYESMLWLHVYYRTEWCGWFLRNARFTSNS